MIDREAVKNRINGLLKEYKTHGMSINLAEEMAEVLSVIEYHNMKKLTFEELLKRDGIPVWVESTDEWLKVNEECRQINEWIILNVYDGRFHNIYNYLPWKMDKGNYEKYWICYERIL